MKKNTFLLSIFISFICTALSMGCGDQRGDADSSLKNPPLIKAGWRWPIDESNIRGITSSFGPRLKSKKNRDFHPGIDIKTEKGTPVFAVADGVVKEPRTASDGGLYFAIEHPLSRSKVYSYYMHMQSMSVTPGQNVVKGQEIGRSGGTASLDHLHFEIRDQYNVGERAAVHPLAYLSDRPANNGSLGVVPQRNGSILTVSVATPRIDIEGICVVPLEADDKTSAPQPSFESQCVSFSSHNKKYSNTQLVQFIDATNVNEYPGSGVDRSPLVPIEGATITPSKMSSELPNFTASVTFRNLAWPALGKKYSVMIFAATSGMLPVVLFLQDYDK